jgi:ATP-dependent DNA helicase 2 subunit 1
MDFDDISTNDVTNLDPNSGEPIEDFLFLDADSKNEQYISLKDCVIFLLDCSPSMHNLFIDTNNENKKTTAITTVLTVAENFLKTKIITNEKDLFGLLLYDTSKTNNEMNFESVNQLIPISSPDANLIKKIKIFEQNTNPELCPETYNETLKEHFDSKKDINKCFLSNALWICHSILKTYDKKNYNRRIFLFTDNDNPLNNDMTERNLVFQHAKDMLENDIIIELFPMNFKDRFDLSKFYINVIPYNEDNYNIDNNEKNDNKNSNATAYILNMEQCSNRIRELTKRIRQKEIKKRTLGKCPLYITNNLKIYMNLYSTLKKANKGRSYNIDARSNKLLNSINMMTCKDTGTDLYPNQIGTYQLYGNKKIKFSKNDMLKIKSLEEPGMKLLGFKSIDSIKPYYNIRESYFLYPNEVFSSGSSQLVDAFIKQLSNKNKCMIIKFVAREGSLIKICALIPQKESFDEDFFQTPPGFNMIVLPFADDIRSNSDIMSKIDMSKINNKITVEQSELTKKLIKKMNISFDCRNFENFSLQKFYSTLQALALEENETEEIDDLIQPDNEGLNKVLKGIDVEFRKSFFKGSEKGKYDENEGKKNGKKRKGKKEGDVDENYNNKKKNVDDMDVDDEDPNKYSDSNLRLMCDNNKLNKLTTMELKQICKLKDISTKGKKKSDLIESLKSYLNGDDDE